MGAIRKLFSYWFPLKWEENGAAAAFFLLRREGWKLSGIFFYAGRCNLKVVTEKMNCQFILHPFTTVVQKIGYIYPQKNLFEFY